MPGPWLLAFAAHCLRAGRPFSNVYYWDSMEALQQLMSHPAHREAKQAQARWLKGYQVVIAQVLHTYGDGGIAHPLKNHAPARPA